MKIMLKPKDNITEEELKKYGFKRCKKPYDQCFYLCIARGSKMIFVGQIVDIFNWEDDDPRIHKKPNCRYKDHRTVLDILYDMIIDGVVVKENG